MTLWRYATSSSSSGWTLRLAISVADSGSRVASVGDDGLDALETHLPKAHLFLPNHFVEFFSIFVDGKLDGVVQRSRHLGTEIELISFI